MKVIIHINKKLNKSFSNALEAWEKIYKVETKTEVPLWALRTDHSEYIANIAKSPIIAEIQKGWSRIVKRKLDPKKGSYVAFSNESEPKMKGEDRIYLALCKVVKNGEDTIIADWFNNIRGRLIKLQTPVKGEYWHLSKKSIFRAELNKTVICKPIKPKDLYITKMDGEKCTLNEKALWKQTEMVMERHGPRFSKEQHNKWLYEAQLRATEVPYKKENKWETIEKMDPIKGINQIKTSLAGSNVKGFVWLMYNHALPVKARYFNKEDDINCPACNLEKETIPHMIGECARTRAILQLVLDECGKRGWHSGILPSKSRIWFQNWDKSLGNVLTQTAIYIAGHHIWTSRNKLVFEEQKLPPNAIIANNIWLELENSIKARIDRVYTLKEWWLH